MVAPGWEGWWKWEVQGLTGLGTPLGRRAADPPWPRRVIWHLQKPVKIKPGLVWGSRVKGQDLVSWSTHFFRTTDVWLKICGLRNVLHGAAGPDQPPHHKPPGPWFASFVFFLGHLLSLAPGACIPYKCPLTPWHRTAPMEGRCYPPFHGLHKRWEPQKDPACKPTSPGYCKWVTAQSCASVVS